jgi:hypothetical protein
MKLQPDANLQLYPTKSNIKLITIPLYVKANGINYNIPAGYKYFFENDAELNNSIITGLSVINRYYPNPNTNIGIQACFTITIKGENDKVLVDELPLANLYDNVIDGNDQLHNYRTVKRFYLKPKWDKCYINLRTPLILDAPAFIYLAVFYKPNGTTNL